MRGRSPSQSVVEFGLVAIMFTMMLMGMIDFGILLNGWLGVSSSARDIARQAAVGLCPPQGVDAYAPSPPPSGSCGAAPSLPTPSSLLIQGVDRSAATPIAVTMNICKPDDLTMCYAATTPGTLSNLYPGGTCSTACAHPAGSDSIQVIVTAQIQVVTPLIRPFFGCLNGAVRCDVPVTSRTVQRYEGPFI